MKQILVAGIGNIFLGDDGFGCEVVRQMASRSLPGQVVVKDFGTRSYDLAYALAENFDAILLVDATPRGDAPGTTYLIEIDLAGLGHLESSNADPHIMTPVHALKMAQSVGPVTAKLYLVGCEPASFGAEEGQLGLSEDVRRAVPHALGIIDSFICEQIEQPAKNKTVQVIA